MFYASYQLPDRYWKAVSGYISYRQAAEAMISQAQGRPWVVSNHKNTLENEGAFPHARSLRSHPGPRPGRRS